MQKQILILEVKMEHMYHTSFKDANIMILTNIPQNLENVDSIRGQT